MEDATFVNETLSCPTVQASILDGAAIVNMLQPGTAKTSSDYAIGGLILYITSQLHNIVRLDIIWDVYKYDSLKINACHKRGKGVRRHVESSSVIPGRWQSFLCIDDNKTELFSLLALSTMASIKSNK